MNRFALPLVGLALLTVLLGIALKQSPQKGLTVTSALLGKPAPHFELPSVNEPGKTISSASYANHWYLLNVWGTWCVECRSEHPVLLDIQREGRVKIVGLDYKDDDAQALEWLARLGNPYDAVAADREGRVAIDWGVYGAPESFLVNPQGIVVRKQVGGLTREIWREKFLPLLGAAP